jgi:hypothetical protein
MAVKKTKVKSKKRVKRKISTTTAKRKKSVSSHIKGRSASSIKSDSKRSAKKVGWRMKGKSTKTPTEADIRAGRAYYEDRPNRSDVKTKGKVKI